MTLDREPEDERLDRALWRETALWRITSPKLRAAAGVLAHDLRNALLAVEEATGQSADPASSVPRRLLAVALDLRHLHGFLREVADEAAEGKSRDDRRLREEAGRCARAALRLAVGLERKVGRRGAGRGDANDVM